jgi:hypothetical protein
MNAKTDDVPAMSKAKELADAICRIDTLTKYQRELIAQAAEELRRLAALEQAAEPVAWIYVGDDYGEELQEWEIQARQSLCDDLNEEHIGNPQKLPLYTHPAPPPVQKAAEPVGWMTESEDGKPMLWPTFAEALTYCDEDERPIPLYTHPARKPMTRDDMRKMLAEHFDNGDLTGDDFHLIRAVERFHQIEE